MLVLESNSAVQYAHCSTPVQYIYNVTGGLVDRSLCRFPILFEDATLDKYLQALSHTSYDFHQNLRMSSFHTHICIDILIYRWEEYV